MSTDDQVAERLQRLVAERGLGAGDRLPPERQLAIDLGVSRSSLREGLRRLIDLGLVRPRRGSGNYLGAVDVEDLSATRSRIEPFAAGLAARRRTDEDLARLERALGALRAAKGDPVAFAAEDEAIHRTIIEAAGSPAVKVAFDALGDLLRFSRATTAVDPQLRGSTAVQLERLVGSIRRGDVRGAEKQMRAHLRAVAAARPG